MSSGQNLHKYAEEMHTQHHYHRTVPTNSISDVRFFRASNGATLSVRQRVTAGLVTSVTLEQLHGKKSVGGNTY